MDATVIAIVRIGLATLADRVLTISTLWMTFGLVCWAMYMPSIERLQLAGGFAVLVYIPALIKERPRRDKSHQAAPADRD
jgi:hypothetical protein